MADGRNVAADGDVAGPQAPAATAIAGPNTGGMGAYSPAPVVTPAVHARVMREVIEPTIARPGGRRHALYGASCMPA